MKGSLQEETIAFVLVGLRALTLLPLIRARNRIASQNQTGADR